MERAADAAAINAIAQEYGSVGGAVQLFATLEQVEKTFSSGKNIT